METNELWGLKYMNALKASESKQEQYCTPKQMALEYNLPMNTVYNWLHRGVLPAKRTKVSILIEKQVADNFMEERKKIYDYKPKKYKSNKRSIK